MVTLQIIGLIAAFTKHKGDPIDDVGLNITQYTISMEYSLSLEDYSHSSSGQ
jgi:hypothetical protein